MGYLRTRTHARTYARGQREKKGGEDLALLHSSNTRANLPACQQQAAVEHESVAAPGIIADIMKHKRQLELHQITEMAHRCAIHGALNAEEIHLWKLQEDMMLSMFIVRVYLERSANTGWGAAETLADKKPER